MSFTSSLSGFVGSLSRARAAQVTFDELTALSDDALASRGLRRNDIARYAFRNLIDV